MKLALEELSVLKNFWLLQRDEKQLGGKDGSEVLLAVAVQSRKGRPFLRVGPHHGKFSMLLDIAAGISKGWPKPEGKGRAQPCLPSH